MSYAVLSLIEAPGTKTLKGGAGVAILSGE